MDRWQSRIPIDTNILMCTDGVDEWYQRKLKFPMFLFV